MKYKVINQRVEINGKTREIGEVLDKTEFKPASGLMVDVWTDNVKTGEEPEPSELESLLATSHVEPV